MFGGERISGTGRYGTRMWSVMSHLMRVRRPIPRPELAAVLVLPKNGKKMMGKKMPRRIGNGEPPRLCGKLGEADKGTV